MTRRQQATIKRTIKNPFLGGAREINPEDRFQGMTSIFTLILRLRQACVHLALTKHALDLDAFKDDYEEDIPQEDVREFDEQFLSDSIGDLKRSEENEVEEIFKPEYESTKFGMLFQRLDGIFKSNDKCVIVSQWTTLFDYMEIHLKKRNIKYASITGKVEVRKRQPLVDEFNKAGKAPYVMLLSLTAGGVGLNLIGGNHLFLMDLHWNPALEKQACDRIYRMGQKKNVHIHKMICNDTIENRVLILQNQKLQLSKNVLDGAVSDKINKLSMDDMRFLFDLGRQK